MTLGLNLEFGKGTVIKIDEPYDYLQYHNSDIIQSNDVFIEKFV